MPLEYCVMYGKREIVDTRTMDREIAISLYAARRFISPENIFLYEREVGNWSPVDISEMDSKTQES